MHALLRNRCPLALASALLVACGAPTHATPRATAERSPFIEEEQEAVGVELTRPSPALPADARIANAVRGELEADPAVDAGLVDIDVREGVVELRGRVPHLLMADAAVSRAEMVHGVRAVLDLIELPRSDRSDSLVAADVEEELRSDPSVEVSGLAVSVVDGVVALRGTVGSMAAQRLAERVARTVRGARAVVSQLALRSPVRRSDREIAADVEAALRADRWVDEWLLEVRVDDGVASLEGVQPTLAAKRRALEAAWVPGARDVDGALLAVEPDLAPAMRRPPAGYAYPDDDDIHEAVRAAIARDPRARRGRVRSEVSEGIVTLEGSVPSLAARAAATDAAEGMRGVWRVENRLRVASPEGPNDAELAQRAERALARAAALDEDAISVGVQRGVVTLIGSVSTRHARTVAEESIARIEGVRGIENALEAPPPIARVLRDAELMQSVIAHLEAHPYVDPGDVQVIVSGGDVLLRGRVDDWRAAREAIRAAYEAGATSVLDDIEVVEGAALAP